ncbi:MAG: mannose-1-phosphate guanylyltransferase [Draconibacterium sp.]|nr:MAG: mannose-1-phosphate guanylyltransferase [Draconibacterium sp.]
MNDTFCIIMAGGAGTRFWPLSSYNRPKQFMDILGTGRTFLQQTFDRFSGFIPVENFLVVTNIMYKELVLEQIPELKAEQVLAEPIRRNTAPCLAYAINKINKKTVSANLVVAPSDHLILKEEEFVRQIKKGLSFVNDNNALLTLGLKPNRAETSYGYIQVMKKGEPMGLENLWKVKTFTEKPDAQMAQVFIDSGEFYWNSGIFMWNLDAIFEAMQTHLPEISALFEKGQKFYDTPDEVHFINKTYSECSAISIDYGIMEKAQNVFVLTADFGWNDMGSWNTLYESMPKDSSNNVITGDNILIYDSKNCIVDIPADKITVIQGLDGYIIAESNETLMICHRNEEHQIKKFVTDARIKKGDSLL